MTLAEIKYGTHNDELLAIIEVFKTWTHYLERFWHKVFVFTDNKNLYWFMNIKSLSSKQVHWAQKLSCYHFQIYYCSGKANRAVDTLFQYPQ